VNKIRWQITGRDGVEVVVVAVDPVDERAERLVAGPCPEPRRGVVGDVPDAQPKRDVGMERDDAAGGVEGAVNVP
jgi:hypothetical protein